MKIISIFTTQAVPGMVVAEDVFTKDNHLIIAKETTLTDKIITRLEFYSIAHISIYSETQDNTQVEPYIESTYYEEIKKSESFHRFHMAYKNVISNFKKTLDSFVTEKKDINPDLLMNEVRKILNECDTNIGLLHMLHCMRDYDDTTYIHSLNVALICNIMGKWLHFMPSDLEILTLCGLLHDIGKLMIPSRIILKPAKLTKDEFLTVKTHTVRGYNLLKNKNIDRRIKHSALMHHERCDGSGYPYGFFSEQIDPFAKLVAIADVFDAMTCARVYRGPLCPFEVVNLFESEGYVKYDPGYIMTFLEGIVQTYINNSVRLNNNIEGEIVLINKLCLSRPVIRTGTEFIDLTKHRDLYISAVI